MLAIPSTNGLYAADVEGNIWRVAGYRLRSPRKMTPHKHKNGYESVTVSVDQKPLTRSVHRLVCEAFHGPIPEGLDVCHLNHIRDDNRPENLCTGTRSENCRMSKQHHGVWRKGVKPACTKLLSHQYKEILVRWALGAYQVDIAEEYGVTQSLVSKIIRTTQLD